MQERELLSDIEGRITHILIGCNTPFEFQEIVSARSKFDEDVRISVMYNSQLEDWLHRLKRMVETTDKEVDCYPIHGIVPIFMQDRIHVFKGKRVMSSLTPTEAERRKQNPTKNTELKTDIIFESDFWEKNGFEIIPNDLGLYNTEGGELIPVHNKLFVGSRLTGEYAYHDLEKAIENKGDLLKTEGELKKRLAKLDTKRELVFVGVEGMSVGEHIDCFFTPIDDNEIFIQHPSGTIDLMGGLPDNFQVNKDYFRNYVERLPYLGDFFNDSGYKAAPMFGLPPLHYIEAKGDKVVTFCKDGRWIFLNEFLVPYMTYNNILQESFTEDGKQIRRIYGPSYIIRKDIFEGLNETHTYEKLIKLNEAAYYMPKYSYTAVMGNVEIRRINVYYRAHLMGSLRCFVKVLEREIS